MRLKEPFQGVKMMQGHIVMHMSTFLVSFVIDPEEGGYFNKAILDKGQIRYSEYQVFIWIKWGHLVSALL